MKKVFKRLFLLIGLGFLIWGFQYGHQMLKIASGYKAKVMCSCVFVSGRTPESVRVSDLNNFSIVKVKVDKATQSTTAGFLGVERKAIYREGLGCTLLSGVTEEKLRSVEYKPHQSYPVVQDTTYWPAGDRDTLAMPAGIDQTALERVLDEAFSEPYPDIPRQTRAMLVIYKGKIVAERYKEGFDKEMPLLGWSMTKSVTNALVGILVKEGKLDIHQAVNAPEWKKKDDPRKAITLNDLLHMSSGLEFKEVYHNVSVVNRILWLEPDAASLTASQALAYPVNTHWDYSSGTSNMISRMIKETFSDQQSYLDFPRKALFDKIGMRSAVMEVNGSTTHVGSSFMFATARDWARFGLLYLNDGVWEGERILPEGWVKYSSTRTPTAKQGFYAAHFWTNAHEEVPGDRMSRKWDGVPADAYYASGYEGQNIVIIPSRETVVVRLGCTPDRTSWDVGEFVAEILAALPEK